MPLAARRLRLVRTIPRPRPHPRMVAAGVWPLVVNGAQPGLAVQIEAIVVAHPGQGEDSRLLVEALDDAILLQTLGDILRRFADFELIHHANSNQVFQLHFHRQGAAGGHAAAAHMAGVLLPRFETVKLGGGDQGRFHQGQAYRYRRARDHTGVDQNVNNHLRNHPQPVPLLQRNRRTSAYALCRTV